MSKNKYNISKNGINIVNKYFDDKQIIFVIEVLTHDGYDEYGPQSNLWTLFIITKENNNYIFNSYYFEDWYEKREPIQESDSMYEFEKKCNIEDIDHYDTYMLNKHKGDNDISILFDKIV
jgi:hypothetical protein